MKKNKQHQNKNLIITHTSKQKTKTEQKHKKHTQKRPETKIMQENEGKKKQQMKIITFKATNLKKKT